MICKQITMAPQSPAHAAYTAAALLCTFALLSSFTHADCGGFAYTCKNIDIGLFADLSASCRTGKGAWVLPASFDLNTKISNQNGKLVDGGGFRTTCIGISAYNDSPTNFGVKANCWKMNGGYAPTTKFNLQRRLSNKGGKLVWNPCRRRSLLEAIEASSAIAGRKMLTM